MLIIRVVSRNSFDRLAHFSLHIVGYSLFITFSIFSSLTTTWGETGLFSSPLSSGLFSLGFLRMRGSRSLSIRQSTSDLFGSASAGKYSWSDCVSFCGSHTCWAALRNYSSFYDESNEEALSLRTSRRLGLQTLTLRATSRWFSGTIRPCLRHWYP